MKILNEIVYHEKLGCGSVTSQTDGSITVAFGEDGTEKGFSYPECFLAELALCDPLAKLELEEELSKKEAGRRRGNEEEW